MAADNLKIENFEELLHPIIKDGKILNYDTKLLTAKGENYGSLLLAVQINIKDQNVIRTLNLVAKLCPPNQWLKKMFASEITFKKEIGFYLEFIPALIQFQKENSVPENKLLAIFPECFNARISLNPLSDRVDDNAVLLLENLRLKGYQLRNRLIGFNLEETKLVLKDLARFHGVPLAFKIKKPNEFDFKLKPFLNRVNIGQEMFDLAADRFTESIYRHLNLNETELQRFIKIMNLGYDFQRNFPSGSEKYATVVHRDFWLNNTMIKYENDVPVSNKMLDFQVNTYGAPATDLIFFLFTSVQLQILEEYYDNFLEIYHQEFVDSLKELNCDVTDYTFESFLEEINYYGPREVSHILVMFRAVFKDVTEDDFDMEKLSMDDMFTDHGVTDIFKNRLKRTVKYFFDKNWL